MLNLSTMKQKLLLLSVFLCFSHCILAQSTDEPVEVMRYSYHVVWVKDKTKPESRSETIAFLDIYNHQSRFSERGFVQRREAEIKTAKDNAMSKEEKIGLVLSYKPRFNWIVYAHGNRLLTYNNSGKNYYQTEEDRTALNWKLNPEPLTWNGFTIQEATTTYGGRNWTVWFTKDIPLSDGPYKFKNLPGFVVKAWDDEEHYSFEFANSEKTTTI